MRGRKVMTDASKTNGRYGIEVKHMTNAELLAECERIVRETRRFLEVNGAKCAAAA